MPSTYTHYAFGCDVYKRLPKDIQDDIDVYRELYDIGQNGPDIFIYYYPFKPNPIQKLHHQTHFEKGAIFFENAMHIHGNRKEDLVYLYGFLCHFVLDASCHPYIEEYRKKQAISHNYLEMAYEKHLLEKNQLNPYKYYLCSHIHPSKRRSEVIARYFKITESKDVLLTLKKMKRMHYYTQATSDFKREIVYKVMDLKKIPYLKDIVIAKDIKECCLESNLKLDELYNDALNLSVALIIDFKEWKLDHLIFDKIFG